MILGALRPLGRLRPLGWLDAYGPSPPGPSTYDAGSLVDALQLWWADQDALHGLVAAYDPGGDAEPYAALWHVEAPEGQDLPYVVVFTAAEAEEQRTTAWACLTTVLQFNFHAHTPDAAAAVRKAFRAAVKGAPLAVDGLTVRHVLPSGQSLQVGEGFAPGGRDSWVATLEVEIPHEVDY
ncbi:hypothetical protein [Paludisphaera mucosa]|uniref:DUF3168 domain-containing protein n=1 Tax=Paludisphaera mucosa TaxID=3030827 RepID=A0ABT6F6R9_9BACT|nr:hypothetical protein [Paludisphaera mucosa]MDG3003249.1 hypothetical protein [Paludisphaera mucosa]